MKLKTITVYRHIFEGEANGKPLGLLLAFKGGKTLHLRAGGDGMQLIANGRPLDSPMDMGAYGQTDIADLTQTLFPALHDVEVTSVSALAWNGKRVGAKLDIANQEPFYFWIDGDELHWGNEVALVSHDWPDGMMPHESGRIVF